MATTELLLTDNQSIRGREDRYRLARVDCTKVIKSWKQSLYSFEWLTSEGVIRSIDDLPMQEHKKRLEIEAAVKKNMPVERPVLGIGIMDNIEIGAGRAIFLTLAAMGHKSIEVHIPKASEDEFRSFMT